MTLLALLLLLATDTVAPIRLTVSPHVAIAPSDLHLKIVIERDVRNRALAVVVDGDHFRYESARAIDGDQAQRVWDIWLSDLPCGEYSIAAAVVRTTDAPRVVDRARLLGPLCPDLEAEP